MKNVFAVVVDVYDELVTVGFASLITGAIYKHQLPANAGGENLVVKCTKLDNEQLQKATVELHLYVPSIDVTTGAITEPMPDDVRFTELEGLLDIAVNNITTADYVLDVTAPGLLEWNPELKKYYLSKTLLYQHENF